MRGRWKRWILLLCGVLLLAALGSSAGAGLRPGLALARARETVANRDEIVLALRQGLREHSSKLTVSFSCGEELLTGLSALAEEWMEAALAETEDPSEGDYIRCQLGGYRTSAACQQSEGLYRYTLEILPDYYAYASQEEEAGRRAEEIIAGFGFTPETTDLEKVEAVYGYLCANVRYDRVHRKHPHDRLRSTAYAALVRGDATCQGYCVALYRLLRMAGVNSRIITGTGGDGEDGLHAWNLAELDGRWYVLDATWDAGREEYRWFLRSPDGLEDHVPGPAFTTAAFTAAYPPAEQDYPAR